MKTPTLLALLALALAIRTASAGLTIDARATSATGTASVIDPKHVSVLASGGVGSTITFSVYAIAIGTNAIVDESLRTVVFDMLTFASGAKGIHGNLVPLTLDPIFKVGATAGGGVSADLNGDGDLDVGGPLSGSTQITTSYIKANAASFVGAVPGVSTDLPGNPAGREWFLGTTTLTLTELLDGYTIYGNAAIPVFPNQLNNQGRASFQTDGVSRNGGLSTAPNIFAGTDVTITSPIPEPSALLATLAGAIALLARSRTRG